MSDKRETLIAPLGYQTTPNQYGVFPEGALAQAQNVVMRNKGKLIAAPGIGTPVSVGTTTTQRAYALAPLDSGHVYAFVNDSSGNTWTVSESGNSASVPPTIASTVGLFPYSRTNPVRSRDRMLVNSTAGVFVGDFMAPTSGSQRQLRFAGLPQLGAIVTTTTAGTNFPIPTGVMVAYTALVTREFSDGYIVKSVPAPAVKVLNNTSPPTSIKVTFGVNLPPSGNFDLAVGDIVEIYRTDGLATTSVDADPGSTFKLIIRHALTSAEITGGFINLFDEVPLLAPFYSTTGKQLYTNPYQEGSTGANRQPEINGAQAVYKGFTFFGNITERPQAEFSVPGGIWSANGTTSGTRDNARANGVGGRIGAGTVVSGNATVTGVSAADMVGVQVGQSTSSGFPPNSRVISVGASSFTMDHPASANDSIWILFDVLECSLFNGAVNFIQIGSGTSLVMGMVLQDGTCEVTTSQTVGTYSSLAATPQNDVGLVVGLEPSRPNVTSFTLRATNGDKYSPPLPLTTQTAKTYSQTPTPNLLRWSKDSEPEHAPSVNETRVGSGKIIQLVSTKDALWIFCTDGIFRLSGDAGVWQINVIAPGCVICSPGCATSMRDAVYAYTNYGFVAVTDAGVVPISDLQIKSDLPGPPYVEGATPNGFLVNNDDDEEVLIFIGFPASKFYVYNARQNAFTYVQNAGTGMSSMTAAEFQQNPASGNAAVLLADTSTAPKYAAWGRGNAGWLAPAVQYRALYAKNPMSVKQWIDMTLFFESSASNNVFSVVGLVGATESTGIASTVAGPVDNTVTFGVIRKYAIATSIKPGFLTGAFTFPISFEGVSMRLVELGNQQVRR